MKKFFFLSILFLLFFISGYSQKDLKFGIKGGINLSEMRSNEFQNKEGHTGYHLGALVSFPLAGRFSLETGLGYSTQGGTAEFSNEVGKTRAEMDLDYLQLPVMIKILVVPKLSINAGTYLNFLVHEEIGAEHTSPFLYSFLPIDPTEIQYDTNDLEVNAALGLNYELSSRFCLYTTFVQGVTNAVEFGEGSVKARNRTYQVGIGYRF
ncbi:outer membrane insertion C-terminal signal [Salinimicrobium catena]|uniref:Outer membrane insertion C-terminal signal n=1 Tax=Salinimicrobium catena TaxID=390640 RepID=A0A1H5IR01_9FLAO|nr:porin family protein [Salinimicrobium catena]SDK79811.1 outer membrane insertion C-terminal signal [Salinimicrobium catena]SEE42656.1 outer membrane insertion C-terminal signal [Salinimicrobium catena]